MSDGNQGFEFSPDRKRFLRNHRKDLMDEFYKLTITATFSVFVAVFLSFLLVPIIRSLTVTLATTGQNGFLSGLVSILAVVLNLIPFKPLADAVSKRGKVKRLIERIDANSEYRFGTKEGREETFKEILRQYEKLHG